MVQISLQNPGGKVIFLRGVPWNPLGHQREWKYLGHLSVNIITIKIVTSSAYSTNLKNIQST